MKKRKAQKQKALLYAMVTSALFFHTPAMSYAEEIEKEYSFDQVVVTASKVAEKEFETKANVSVITREEIETRHYRDLGEILRDVPGVILSNYGAGGEGYMANKVYINGTSQVVVLVDGIRANVNGSTYGTFVANEFNSLDNIERIEVLKGSASTLYGSDAKGGVINIITRKVDGNKTTINLEGGSYDRESYSLVNQGRSGDFSWVVTSKKEISGDYSDAKDLAVPSHQNAETATLKLSQKLNDASDLTLNYEKYTADYTRSGTNFKLSERHYGKKDNEKLSLIYNYQFADGSKNQLTIFRNKNYLNDDYTSSTKKWLMDLETVGIQDQYTRKMNERHTVIAGYDFYQDKIKNYNDSYSSYKGKTISNRAFYLQDSWDLTKQWNLTSGIRFDNHSIYGTHNTPSVVLGYKQNDNTNYYASYKEYFVSPNQYQLFGPYGGSYLKPESGNTVEAGINHKFDNTLRANFHVFSRKSTDVIGFSYTDWKYHNINEEKACGWDLQFDKKLSEHLNAYVGYTYTHIDAASGEVANANGTIPKGSWNVGLNYHQDKYDIDLQGRGVIEKPGPTTGKGAAFPESTYWVWNMAANYKVNSNMKAYVKVNNMFNQYYAEVSNVAYGSAGEWYASPGRNYQAGIQYQF